MHSYLTYLRDLIVVVHKLLAETGSIFVQISGDNVHRVSALLDEVFGASNLCSLISFNKASSASGDWLASVADFLLWYARDADRMTYRQLHTVKSVGGDGGSQYTWVQTQDGAREDLGTALRFPQPEVPRITPPRRVLHGQARDLGDAAFDRVHQSEIGDDPGEGLALGIAAALDAEGRGRKAHQHGDAWRYAPGRIQPT